MEKKRIKERKRIRLTGKKIDVKHTNLKRRKNRDKITHQTNRKKRKNKVRKIQECTVRRFSIIRRFLVCFNSAPRTLSKRTAFPLRVIFNQILE